MQINYSFYWNKKDSENRNINVSRALIYLAVDYKLFILWLLINFLDF